MMLTLLLGCVDRAWEMCVWCVPAVVCPWVLFWYEGSIKSVIVVLYLHQGYDLYRDLS